MNEHINLEASLEALGASLRSRPRLADRVMDEVRRAAADGSNDAQSTPALLPMGAPRRMLRGRRQFFSVAAGTIASISAALLAAIMMLPSPSVGWAEVTRAVEAQPWIRGTATFPQGGQGTMWLSSEQKVWAFQVGGSTYFYDGVRQVKYELRAGEKAITKLPLGEDDAEKVLAMNALSQDKSAVGHWLFGMEKVVSQAKREVTDSGKTWVEFQLTLWRGDMNRATLRVDPGTRLPVYLLFVSPKDASKSIKWQFDYPANGPSDIYALGVSRDLAIADRMPSNDALAALRAITKSRNAIGDFRLLVGQYPRGSNYFGAVVLRKGDRWRIDGYWDRGDADVATEPPEDQNWADWFDDRLKRCTTVPLSVCDGKTIWENSNREAGAPLIWKISAHNGPQDLMSGDGFPLGDLSGAFYVKIASLAFPDLSPQYWWKFEFDPHPADAPGCVLFKRSADTSAVEPTTGHEWYYVDPTKGHALVRAELFNLPPNVPATPETARARTTVRMDGYVQTKRGFWYPTVVHEAHGVNRESKTTVRYHFDFAAELPDSLFVLDNAQDAGQ